MHHFIRAANEKDIDIIMKIEENSFSPEIQENKQVFLDRIATFPEGTFLFFESEKTEASGYFSSEIWESIPPQEQSFYTLGHSASERHITLGSVLYISSFAVLPSSRGGAGRILFKESTSTLFTSFPLLKQIIFIVHEDWLAARHIYETEGFIYTGTLPNFFGQKHALIMEKKL